MSRGVIQPSQQKLAEKLTILNDRGIGMLTRVYNIKKVRTRSYINSNHTELETYTLYGPQTSVNISVGDSMND